VNEHLNLSEETRRVLDTFRVIRTIQDECGERAANTYIISMTTSPDDLLGVLLLAREAGLVDLTAEGQSRIDVVPLFETLDDLERAPEECSSTVSAIIPCLVSVQRTPSQGGVSRRARWTKFSTPAASRIAAPTSTNQVPVVSTDLFTV
jgi:hypothetical protein